MKTLRIAIALMLAMVAGFAQAQIDRSQPPKPGPAPAIQIGEYETFTLPNGLKVFVVENHKLPRVAFNLVLDIDPIAEGEKAGYIDMTGQLMRQGTESMTKEQLDEAIDFIGGTVSTYASGMSGASLKKHSGALLEIMSDLLLNPSFPEEELEKLRKQTISGLAAAKDNPNSVASNVVPAVLFGKKHPFGEVVTEETVDAISVDDCRQYYSTYFRPNVGYLAIVGDITPKEAKKLVEKYFGKWKKAEVPGHKHTAPQQPAQTQVALVDKPNAVQSVINIGLPIDYSLASDDYMATQVMNQILGGGGGARLFNNLRETKAYTYGAYSNVQASRVLGRFNASASVRNEVTDSSLVEFFNEFNRLLNEPVEAKELQTVKNKMAGNFSRSLENPQTVAGFALNIARYGLPSDFYANYLKALEAVTVEDVQAAAKRHLRTGNMHIVIVGNASEIEDKLAAFGPVTAYDEYGDKEVAIAATPETESKAWGIIDRYLEALGGKEKLEAVQAISSSLTMSMMGTEIQMSRLQASPDKMKTEITMNGQVIQAITINGKYGYMAGQGGEGEIPKENMESYADAGLPFPELHYLELGYKLEYKGEKKVKKQMTDVLEVTTPTGEVVKVFFSQETGLKVKQEGEQQSVSIYAYKEVEGIMFPSEMSMTMGPGTLDAEAGEIIINPELKGNEFDF